MTCACIFVINMMSIDVSMYQESSLMRIPSVYGDHHPWNIYIFPPVCNHSKSTFVPVRAFFQSKIGKCWRAFPLWLMTFRVFAFLSPGQCVPASRGFSVLQELPILVAEVLGVRAVKEHVGGPLMAAGVQCHTRPQWLIICIKIARDGDNGEEIRKNFRVRAGPVGQITCWPLSCAANATWWEVGQLCRTEIYRFTIGSRLR